MNLVSSNLKIFTKHKEQVCFLFICAFFTCFVITLFSTFSYFSTACKHAEWLCSLFACCFGNHYVIALSTFCNWTSLLKWTPKWTYVICLVCQFSWWSLNFLKIRLTSVETRMFKLSNSPCSSVLLWTSFCFLQVNHQKHVRVVSTNNIMYSEQIYKTFE